MSDSVQPHRRQPTRLPRPWDSPGKNTGVGCHFLLQGMKVKSESEVAQLCPTLSDPMDCSPPGSSFHGLFQARVLEWVAIALLVKKKQESNFQGKMLLHRSLRCLPLLPRGEMPGNLLHKSSHVFRKPNLIILHHPSSFEYHQAL